MKKPREIFQELLKLNTGELSDAISSKDEYGKIVIYASLLVNNNIQYSKVYLGDKLLGTINRYRYKKVMSDVEGDSESEEEFEAENEVTNLFSRMISSYLSIVKVNDNLIKTLIIFLVTNDKISEFRNIPKLSDSSWGIRTIEYINNLGINSKLLMETFLTQFDDYPIHKKLLEPRLHECIVSNNGRERYLNIVKSAWSQGELSAKDPIEQQLGDAVLSVRSKIRSTNLNIQVKDMCNLLEMPYGTYGNKKREFQKSISKYFYNSVYSNLIDLITSLK